MSDDVSFNKTRDRIIHDVSSVMGTLFFRSFQRTNKTHFNSLGMKMFKRKWIKVLMRNNHCLLKYQNFTSLTTEFFCESLHLGVNVAIENQKSL